MDRDERREDRDLSDERHAKWRAPRDKNFLLPYLSRHFCALQLSAPISMTQY
jgi:hypothetical protein